MSVSVSALVSDSESLSEKTCCSTCLGCQKGRDRVKFYEDLISNGTYFYALGTKFEGNEPPVFEGTTPACLAIYPEPYPELDSYSRSRPVMLAYVDIYASHNMKNVMGVDPDLMAFKMSGGCEFVDEELVQKKIKTAEIKKKTAEIKKKMLDIRKLAKNIMSEVMKSEKNMYYDSEAPNMTQQLIVLMDSIVIDEVKSIYDNDCDCNFA